MEEEKNLKNFIFSDNHPVGTSIDDVVKEINAHYRVYEEDPDFFPFNITSEDIKFGPENPNFPESSGESKIGVYIYYDDSAFEKIGGLEESKSLKNVVDNLSEERYIEILGVQTSGSNKFTDYSVNKAEVVTELSRQQGWEFEKVKGSDSKIGYLTVEGFTYMLKSIGSPSRLVLYAENGEVLDLSKGYEKHKQVLETIRRPIKETLIEEKEKNKVFEFSTMNWFPPKDSEDNDDSYDGHEYAHIGYLIAELRDYLCFEETEEGIKLGDYFLVGWREDIGGIMDSMCPFGTLNKNFEIVKEVKSEVFIDDISGSGLEFTRTGYNKYGSLSLCTADKELVRAGDMDDSILKMFAFHVHTIVDQLHRDYGAAFKYQLNDKSTIKETMTNYIKKSLV